MPLLPVTATLFILYSIHLFSALPAWVLASLPQASENMPL